jgi:hypothetical protein
MQLARQLTIVSVVCHFLLQGERPKHVASQRNSVIGHLGVVLCHRSSGYPALGKPQVQVALNGSWWTFHILEVDHYDEDPGELEVASRTQRPHTYLMAFLSGSRSSAAAATFLRDAFGAKWDFGKIAPSLRPRMPDCGGKAVLILACAAAPTLPCASNNFVRDKSAG